MREGRSSLKYQDSGICSSEKDFRQGGKAESGEGEAEDAEEIGIMVGTSDRAII